MVKKGQGLLLSPLTRCHLMEWKTIMTKSTIQFSSLFWLFLFIQSMTYPLVLANPIANEPAFNSPTILVSTPADPFLYFAENDDSVPAPESPTGPAVTPINESSSPAASADELVQGSPFVCRFSELTPEENANILDFVKKGEKLDQFVGTPQDPNDLNESLPQDVALVPDAKGEIAFKQPFPSQLFKPDQVGFLLNRSGTGAFATGLVMQDSFRVGRCVGLQQETTPQPIASEAATISPTESSQKSFDALLDKKQRNLQGETCWLETPGLNYPNYDQPVANGVPILGRPGLAKVTNSLKVKDILTWRTDPVYEQSLGPDALSLVEAAAVTTANANSLSEADPESDTGVTTETVQRNPGLIPNRWQTDDFTAKLQTPCANSSCSITVYSLFAKYFNSAASVSMVVSNFGPTLFSEAGRLFGRASKLSVYPWEGTFGTLKKRVSEAFLGKNIAKNAARQRRTIDLYKKYPELKSNFVNSLTKGDEPAIFAAGGGEGKIFDAFKPEGFVAKYLDTPQKQRDFTQFIYDFRAIIDTTDLQLKAINAEFAEGAISKLTYQKKIFNALSDLDEPDPPGIDFMSYFLKDREFGLSDAWYFNQATGSYQPISSKNFGLSLKSAFKDVDQADFGKLAADGIDLTDSKAVKLFKLDAAAS